MASIIRKPGSQYWHACYRDHTGRQRRKSTKETDRKKASRLAELYERIAQRRLKPDRVRQAVAEVMEEAYPSQFPAATVRERVTQWLTLKRAAVEESTFLFYSKGAEKFLAFLKESADLDIGEIEKRHIAAFRDSLLQKVSVTTARHDLKTVKAIFETAKDDGYLDRDPTEGVKVRDRSGESIRRAFTLEELHAIVEIADPEWQSLIRFGLYTGQRLGDCSRLTWAHIDTARNLIPTVSRHPIYFRARSCKALILSKDSIGPTSLSAAFMASTVHWFNSARNCRFSLFWETAKLARIDVRRESGAFEPRAQRQRRRFLLR